MHAVDQPRPAAGHAVVVALFSWLQATGRGAGQRRAARWERWAGAGAVIGVIAVFTSTYSVPISQQRHRTLDSFWFFVLSNPYVLTTVAIALVLGADWLRSAGSSPSVGQVTDTVIVRDTRRPDPGPS